MKKGRGGAQEPHIKFLVVLRNYNSYTGFLYPTPALWYRVFYDFMHLFVTENHYQMRFMHVRLSVYIFF